MKRVPTILGILVLAALSAHAQCKDCGCKEKCSPKCRCQHDEKPKTQ